MGKLTNYERKIFAMKSLIEIIYNTQSTFQKLDTFNSNNLNLRSTLIFYTCGLVNGFHLFITESNQLPTISIWIVILYLLIFGLLNVIIGSYILSPFLFFISKSLKGKSEFIDVKIVTAYSMIPSLIEIPIKIYKYSLSQNELVDLNYTVLNIAYFLIWLLSIKILFQGIRYFNEFGIFKSLVNISPFVFITIVFYLFFFSLL